MTSPILAALAVATLAVLGLTAFAVALRRERRRQHMAFRWAEVDATASRVSVQRRQAQARRPRQTGRAA